ncbi:MAG: hypothetical protein JWN71_2253 [Xanthobacteraceae bacterium]|nr:hypothetical protein [Xanthobacteraceae bacterium]
MSITAGSSERIIDRFAIAILIATAAVVAVTFRDFGLGWDDYTHAQYGDLLLSFYGSGFSNRDALKFVNLYYYGGGFDMAAALLAKVLPFDLFETRRLAGGLFGVIGLFVTWRLTRRIGGALSGLFALLLLASCPHYVGHVFMNPKDGPFAVAVVLMLYGLIRVIDGYPKPTLAANAWFGVGLGLAFGTRIMAVLIAFSAAVAFMLFVAIEIRELGTRPAFNRVGRFLLAIIPGLLIFYVTMGLIWPWAVIDPLNPFRAVSYFSHFFEAPWRELFAGRLILVPDMPRSYVPTLLALKLPEVLLVLGLIGAVGALVAACRRDFAPPRRAILLTIAMTAVLPVAIAVITRPAMYNGIRHFVFLIPPLAILGGLAASYLIDHLARRAKPLAGVAALLIVIGVISPVVDMVRLHPYEYTHYNRIAGGVKGADGRYMLDFWGLSFKQAAQALNAKLEADGIKPPPGRKWKIAVCGPHPPAKIALGPDFDEPLWEPKGADFLMLLGEFYCVRPNAPVLAEVARDGVPYAQVYDIRGRDVTRLLTLPPP